ncbi:hypothetical protein DPMN_063388 [Dreissena polymorpha]|uniref:Uncharacterized protein n=1 Tax=Dreissena polymorpha TaxID=45954 RepID=A0A9D4CB89_DREPO|nr:hypothetical protein DPMN_063388 [Dreissena polymorpha]
MTLTNDFLLACGLVCQGFDHVTEGTERLVNCRAFLQTITRRSRRVRSLTVNLDNLQLQKDTLFCSQEDYSNNFRLELVPDRELGPQ